ncbi:unnamed protein product [Penicillium pancosmium]
MAQQRNTAKQDSGVPTDPPPPVNLILINPVEPVSPRPIWPVLDPPDGRLKPWTQAVMGHLVAFNTWGYIASFGVFQAYYQSVLGVSPSAISWVGGVLLQLVGVFMTSLATEYWQLFFAQGVCTGLGNGLQFCPVTGLVATYFSDRRVFALAFVLVGSGTGGMLFPGLVKTLIPAIGFAWTVRILGFVMLGTSIPAMALLQPRLPPLSFLSYENSNTLIIVTNGSGIVGRLIPAYLADRSFEPLNTSIPLTLGASLMMFCWTAVHSTPGLYVFALLYGIFSNGLQGLWSSTLSSLTPDLIKTGVRIGMGFTFASFA